MAKKNNPQDEQAEKMLHNALGRYQEMLFKAANTPQSESVYQYRARFINAMAQSSKVVAETAYSVAKGLPSLQTPVSELLRSFGARYGGEEIKLTTYVRMTSALTKSVDEYRASLEQKILERERQGKVTTVADLRDIINEDLGSGEVTAVTYGSGAKMPVDKYAAMLARTTRAETENLSMITQALKEGIDLVECDIVSPTCDSCAVYQGRVYSISGKDSRYPSLYQTAFKSGYSIIHPNCRHSWSPYHAELYTDDEKRDALERSNRSWKPDGNGRNFQQMEKAREAYAIGQQKQRQWNAEILEYERMKAHYKGIGEEPPYQTLGEFRRAKRADELSPKFKAWRYRENDEQQFEEWKEIFGDEFPLKTVDELQKIKYNKNKKEYKELVKQKNKILLGKEKQREPNNFILAKTVQEAEGYISTKAKNVSYSGITNVKSLNQANRTYAYLAEKYGLNNLDEISTNMVHESAFAESHGNLLRISPKFANTPQNEDVIRSTSGWTEERKIGLEAWENRLVERREKLASASDNNLEMRRKAVEEAERKVVDLTEDLKYSRHNVCYENREVESIVAHETGHIIAEQKFQQLTKPYETGGKAERVYKVFNQAKQTGDIYKISKYASTNVKEFFAECFTVYELGEEELPDYIKEMIKEILE